MDELSPLLQKAVIPVAGLGTRMLPATKSQPKEMLPVGRKPVVQYVVEEMEAASLSEILFVTGRHKTSIEDHFDRDPDLVERLRRSGGFELLDELKYEEMNLKVFYTRQRRIQGGLADAVAAAEQFVNQSAFVVALGDTIIGSPHHGGLMRKMMESHLEHGSDCTIAVETVRPEDVRKYGIVVPKEDASDDFPISDLVEKPTPASAPSNLAIAARYVFNPSIFDAIRRTSPDTNGELQLTDAIRVLLRGSARVRCVCLRPDEARYDIGSFESYFKAFIDFALADEKFGYLVRQHLLSKPELQ